MKRLKTRCPTCQSRKLIVLGAESQRDCQIACQRCGAHTKRRRTVFSLSKVLKDQTFTGLCGCRAA